jgi:hypothetical protein
VSRQPLRFWWIGVSALLVCLGSVGPWAKVLFVTASGLDGDGWISLIAGLAALALFAVYVRSDRRPRPLWPLVLILGAGGVAAAIGVYDWSKIEGVVNDTSQEDDPFDLSSSVTVGWGLVLVTLAGFSLCLSAIVTFVRRRQEPSAPVPPAAPVVPGAQDPES